LTATETLLVVEKSSHRLSFYDLAEGRCEGSVPLPQYPHEFVVDADGQFAYVGHYGVQCSAQPGDGGRSVLVIDLARRAHVRSIDCDPFRRLHGIRMDQAGRLYVLSEQRAMLLVFDDPRHAERPDRALPVGGLKSHLFALTRCGERAFCMNLLSHSVTRVSPWDPLAPIAAACPGGFPEGICLSADETELFVTNRRDDSIVALDAETLEVRRRGQTGRDPARVYLLGDGRPVVTNYGGKSLSVFEAGSLRETARLSFGAHPIALSFHPARPEAYVSLDSNELALVDVASMAVTRRFATALEPDVSHLLARRP